MTFVDVFHDLTHQSDQLPTVTHNDTIRRLIHLVADFAQYLQNCNSNHMARHGIYDFDKPELVRRLRQLQHIINTVPVVDKEVVAK